ncbi:hypothetical protein C5L14_09485 [Labrys okinawensis]|uniref:4Fe-4S ferredoxin-type domain-containing protein n=1 Tax=Labrys okinawensis TaxID=346911 RepID=A0A2S9QG40_9HYPH|nr:hypothetical protein C5L14_09485 [Labrys okinawensis]
MWARCPSIRAIRVKLADLSRYAEAAGLSVRGAFHPRPEDGVPSRDTEPVGTLVLLGWAGGRHWPSFAASPEAVDGALHPLDRWSERVIGAMAKEFGAAALYPFGGPSYWPFQRWAQRGDNVFASPLGMYVHPVHGLWHSYRGALCFRQRLDLPPKEIQAHPCESCAAKPCLDTCPVGAFTTAGYDVERCAAHVRSAEGAACRQGGCLARRACPVAPGQAYGAEEAGFYMKAFLAAH